jgi:HEAT repeat protein
MRALIAGFVLLLVVGVSAQAPTPAAKDAVTAEQVRAAVDRLGSVEFPVRTEASRTVRRGAANVSVPILTEAATNHKDSYVRYRALVLLSGFNDPSTRDLMKRMLDERNDRVRAVAYTYFEHTPEPAVVPRLIAALAKEESEFVRPALMRALAAYGADPAAQKALGELVMKGQDFFRSGVIEAVGDYKGTYAFASLNEIAKLDGPLQDDAVIALGKIGDKRAVATLANLQRTASKNMQPMIAAAICLLGVNCASHQAYLVETLRFSIANTGFQELLRGSASGLASLAETGNEEALSTLFELGGPTRDPARAAIALALGTVALRNAPLMLKTIEKQKDPSASLDLLSEAFDMLEEDFEEERFFVFVRRTYWQAAAGSPTRKAADALIQKLEF